MSSPYAPPQSVDDSVSTAGLALSSAGLDALRGTKKWVLLIGILLFLLAAFSVVGGAGMALGSSMMGAAAKGGPGPGFFIGMGVVYLIFAVVYILMGWYLVRYSAAIGRVVSGGQSEDLDEALLQQSKFWRLAGVLVLLSIILFVIGMVAAIAIPSFMDLRR
jgi:hypothetical protein